MSRYARFALWVSLAGGIPVVVALTPPPQRQQQQKQQEKQDEKRKPEPAKQAAPPRDEGAKEGDGRLNRRNTRMKERDREIDRMVNTPKK
jgi:hypothetical protein